MYLRFPLNRLGFGVMNNLPKYTNLSIVNLIESEQLFLNAVKNGINYFETSPFYSYNQSEEFMSLMYKKYSKIYNFYVACKLPIKNIHCEKEILDLFNGQLLKFNVDFFDFYLIQAIDDEDFRSDYFTETVKCVDDLRVSGRIKNLGISLHCSSDNVLSIIEKVKPDFVQLQYNLWSSEDIKKSFDLVCNVGIPIFIMKPLGGGKLLHNLKKGLDNKEIKLPINLDSFCFNWLLRNNNVKLILSGMDNADIIQRNSDIFKTELEPEIFDTANKIVHSDVFLNELLVQSCLKCGYCLKACRFKIDIMNIYCNYTAKSLTVNNITQLSKCIECFECEKNCPQHLDIKKVIKELKTKYHYR